MFAVFVYNDVDVSSIGFSYHWKYNFYIFVKRRWFNKSKHVLKKYDFS